MFNKIKPIVFACGFVVLTSNTSWGNLSTNSASPAPAPSTTLKQTSPNTKTTTDVTPTTEAPLTAVEQDVCVKGVKYGALKQLEESRDAGDKQLLKVLQADAKFQQDLEIAAQKICAIEATRKDPNSMFADGKNFKSTPEEDEALIPVMDDVCIRTVEVQMVRKMGEGHDAINPEMMKELEKDPKFQKDVHATAVQMCADAPWKKGKKAEQVNSQNSNEDDAGGD